MTINKKTTTVTIIRVRPWKGIIKDLFNPQGGPEVSLNKIAKVVRGN